MSVFVLAGELLTHINNFTTNENVQKLLYSQIEVAFNTKYNTFRL